MVMKNDLVLMKNGKRVDGRKAGEMRPVKMSVGVLERADGSALVEVGNTRVLAAVFGPRELHPQHRQNPKKGVLQVRYNMAPFSVNDRIRPGPNRRAKEISLVTRKALEDIIFLEEFPRAVIDVYVEILEADASTRVTGINAASLALADAGIPMKGLISAVAVGKVEDTLILDVAGKEDAYGTADIPISTVNDSDEVTLMQLDGEITPKEVVGALELAKEGCKKMYENQKEALKQRYQKELENHDGFAGDE